MFETTTQSANDHSGSFMYWSVPYYWIRELRLSKKSERWTSAEGVVESTHRTKGGYKGTIRAELWYSYTFESKSYRGHVIRDCCFAPSEANRLVEQEVGQKISILVNSKNPEESYYPSGFGSVEPFLMLFLSLLGTSLIAAIILDALLSSL